MKATVKNSDTVSVLFKTKTSTPLLTQVIQAINQGQSALVQEYPYECECGERWKSEEASKTCKYCNL